MSSPIVQFFEEKDDVSIQYVLFFKNHSRFLFLLIYSEICLTFIFSVKLWVIHRF